MTEVARIALIARRDQLMAEAQEALANAETFGAYPAPRFQKDARIYIDRASDALAETSRIDKMIGLL